MTFQLSIGRSLFAFCLIGGAAAAPTLASTGGELAQLCRQSAEPCTGFISRLALAHGDDKTICLPNGYQPAHLRQAYIEWAAASDQDLLGREPAEKAVLSAFKELYSCEE
jgi:hypothetical protein